MVSEKHIYERFYEALFAVVNHKYYVGFFASVLILQNDKKQKNASKSCFVKTMFFFLDFAQSLDQFLFFLLLL